MNHAIEHSPLNELSIITLEYSERLISVIFTTDDSKQLTKSQIKNIFESKHHQKNFSLPMINNLKALTHCKLETVMHTNQGVLEK